MGAVGHEIGWLDIFMDWVGDWIIVAYRVGCGKL